MVKKYNLIKQGEEKVSKHFKVKDLEVIQILIINYFQMKF